MTYDTTKDPRIIVAHLACNLLKKCIKQKTTVPVKISKENLPQLQSACESAVLTLMYMYQEPESLVSSDPVLNVTGTAQTMAGIYEKLLESKEDRSLVRATIRWCLRTLHGLGKRLGNPNTGITAGIDLVVVHVRNAAKQGSFLRTTVNDGNDDYSVVTNMLDVKTNSKLAAAFLPPREIDGTVSEAMFLGNGLRTESVGTLLDEKQADAKEAAAILYDEVVKHLK